MSNKGRWIAGGGALAGLAGAAVAVRTATGRFHRRTAELVHRMVAHPEPLVPADAPDQAVDGLPDPVRRFLRAALPDGPRPLRTARLTSSGTFRQIAAGMTRSPESGWFPFTATQTVMSEPPAFVWAATMNMRPFVKVFVRDTYLNGRGSMQGSALGLVSVVDAAGSPELNAGALMRYLAEAPWVPDMLVPGPRLVWTAIDDRHAQASLTDSGTTVSVVFEFAPSGDIIGVEGMRPRATDQGYELTPWRGRFWQHELRTGRRVPVRAEVGWTLDGAEQLYWRGEILDTEYDYALPSAS